MLRHRIYLRGPWRHSLTARAATDASGRVIWTDRDLPVAGTARLPETWETLFGDFRGRVQFRRNFHRPTNLDPDERVCLEFEGVGGTGSISVNGNPVGALESRLARQSFDVTAFLTGNDELLVEIEFLSIESADRPGGLYGPVSLAIYHEDSPSTPGPQ